MRGASPYYYSEYNKSAVMIPQFARSPPLPFLSSFLPFFLLSFFFLFSRSAYDSTEFLLLVQRTTHFSLSRVNSIWKKWKRFFARIRFSNALSVLRSLFKPLSHRREKEKSVEITIREFLLFHDLKMRERFRLEEWINKDYSCDHECAIKLNGGTRDRSNCVEIERDSSILSSI